MKNLKSTKPRVIMFLASLLVLLGGSLSMYGVLNGSQSPVKASGSFQLQEVWHKQLSAPVNSVDYKILTNNGNVYQYDAPFLNGYDEVSGSQVYHRDLTAIGPNILQPVIDGNRFYIRDYD